mgnify:CR=1 FL=1
MLPLGIHTHIPYTQAVLGGQLSYVGNVGPTHVLAPEVHSLCVCVMPLPPCLAFGPGWGGVVNTSPN